MCSVKMTIILNRKVQQINTKSRGHTKAVSKAKTVDGKLAGMQIPMGVQKKEEIKRNKQTKNT